ncbi:MAG TPA: polysaccharide lyase family 8 super-sandwich domain-containing protein [Phnomibacter sp.]|nr:polysaccharide lyase family 8 super-sandwich domain-containing protein [Phnomibacter sp.]
MNRKRKFVLPALFLALLVCGNLMAQDEFDIVRKNITGSLVGEGKVKVDGFKKEQQVAGNWKDIDYKDSSITRWQPIKHLQRIKAYCIAMNQSQCCLREHIVSGLRYWLAVSPKSKNWWHNDIAVPQTMGEILLLADEAGMQYPKALKDSLLESMKKGDPYKQTGANKVDEAIHYLFRACVTKDRGLMQAAVQQVFEPIAFTNAEGLQTDFSYLQHGRQLQLSSYGMVFLMGEYKVASWVMNTSFAISPEKLKLLHTYLTQTYLKAIRGQYSDFNIEGRGLSRPNVLNKRTFVPDGYTDKANTPLVLAKKLYPSDTTQIAAALLRISGLQSPGYAIDPYHKHFYKADYTLHLRKDYSFNVRMVSDRTRRTETGNNENLLGKFLPDGSTNIQRTGGEYFNIMPLWEWGKIPGITCRDFADDQPTTPQWGEPGSTGFVGGVSDGKYGCTVYDMQYNQVSAKKSWFFFDKEVVCLGSGIHCAEEENITTTLNQCWQKGAVYVQHNKKLTKIDSVATIENPSWVWHDSIGYYFLQPGKAVISGENQKGSWSSINAAYDTATLHGKLFKLFIGHGAKPAHESYAYCVVPSIGLSNAGKYPVNNIQVLANTESQQAVVHKPLQMLQVCFYTAGFVQYGTLKITVDKPCVVLVKRINTPAPEIWIADPGQQQNEITLWMQMQGKKLTRKVNWKDADNRGSSVLVNWH